ncbi:WbuC family cupin fold metalloprotein [Burkholderiaceae bacterium DAT-1]|nr:WbuC family cupin fold metalloprotein [Burkholderiaceae bacterium DAT-1]
MTVQLLSQQMLEALTHEANAIPRLRKNLNFHESDESVCHRLLNAIEPNSYVIPHRHLEASKAETMIVVKGALGILIFDDAGTVVEQHRLAPGGDIFGIDLPPGTWHSVVSLQVGTVFFEAKAGPYTAPTAAERASWAPMEGDEAADAYLKWMRAHFHV